MFKRLQCPTCGRTIQWSEQFPNRPFCSERCQLIDLGAWLSGQRAIAGDAGDHIEDPSPDARHAEDPSQGH
jgi:hypothetical protein